VTARAPLTTRRVRLGVGTDLICQPDPRPGIKTHSSALLHRPPVVPQATASSAYPLPGPTLYRTYTTRPIGKCRCATTGPYSLDTSAAISRRPPDCASTLENDADEAPGVPAGRWRLGHATTSHAGLLSSFKPHARIYNTSSRLHRGRQGRISTLIGCVTPTSLLPRTFPNLHHRWLCRGRG
jgi:hypothetical protein